MINEKITHTIFGKGTVLSVDDNYMTILFDNSKYGEKVFVYPESFERYLSFDSIILQEKTSEALKAQKKKIRDEKSKDEAIYTKHQHDITIARLEFTKKRTPAAKPKTETKTKAKTKQTKIKNPAEAVLK